MPKKRKYKSRSRITVSVMDDPNEYHRQYYHLVIKRRRKLPRKHGRRR